MHDGSLLAFLCGGRFASIGVIYCLFRDRFPEPQPVRARVASPPSAARVGLTRRRFGRAALGLAVVGLGATLPSGRLLADDTALVTDVPANAATVKAVAYANESAKPGQQCKNCILFQPVANGRGRCSLFAQGLVSEQGGCSSWVAKSS